MGVARHGRVRPDLDPCAIGADAGERQRHRDVQVSRKALRGLARGPFEDAQRLGDAFNPDVVLDQMRRAKQARDRLPRHELYRMNGPDRRRGHRIEPDQRAGRHDDLAAMGSREFDEVLVLQQRADAEHHRGLAALDHRRHDRADHLARRALDHDVGDLGKLFDRHQLRRRAELRDPAAMLVRAVRRHRNQRQALDALVERLDDIGADRAETGDRHPQLCLPVCHHFPPASCLTRR
ncbi:hypothetical protein ACVILL_004930 [Bradyrhizobium sp. USDA 3364]